MGIKGDEQEAVSALTVKCPSCGGTAFVNPATGKLQCRQCDSVLNVGAGEAGSAMAPDSDGRLVDKRSLKELKKLARLKRYLSDMSETVYTAEEINRGVGAEELVRELEMDTYECISCGAKLMVKRTETSSFCAYCGQPMILVDKMEGEFSPDIIIPFAVKKERAEQLIRERLGRGWFVPPEVRRLQVDEVKGIYIPFWVSSFNVRRKLRYTKLEERMRKDKGWSLLEDNKETETVVHHCLRDCEAGIYDLAGDAARWLNDNLTHRLEPYDIDEAVDFSPEYLSGFHASRYDVPPDEVLEAAKERAFDILTEEMLSGEDVYKISSDEREIKVTDVKYALLPIWFITYRHKGISYMIAVNGQTEKVVGNVPVDKKSVIATSAGILMGLTLSFAYAGAWIGSTFAGMLGVVPVAVAMAASYFAASLRKFRRTQRDSKAFRSRRAMQYIRERQEQTWTE